MKQDGFTGNQRLTPIRTTVASERLDCVIAALTGLSREAAQTAVRSGLCEVEFETEAQARAWKPEGTLAAYLSDEVTGQPGQSMGAYWAVTRLRAGR